MFSLRFLSSLLTAGLACDPFALSLLPPPGACPEPGSGDICETGFSYASLRQMLERTGLEERLHPAAGMEETFTTPQEVLRHLFRQEEPPASFERAVSELARSGRLVDSRGGPLPKSQWQPFLHTASAVDHLFAHLDALRSGGERASRTLEAIRSALPPLSSKAFSSASGLVLSLLENSGRIPSAEGLDPIAFVDLVSLYSLVETLEANLLRSALHTASAVDNLGTPPKDRTFIKTSGRRSSETLRKAKSYADKLGARLKKNLALPYRISLPPGVPPSQTGLAAVFLRAAVERRLPYLRGKGSLAPRTFMDRLSYLSHGLFRPWLAEWWAEGFAGEISAALGEDDRVESNLIIGYLKGAQAAFSSLDIPAGLVQLEEAQKELLRVSNTLQGGISLRRQMAQQIAFLRQTERPGSGLSGDAEGLVLSGPERRVEGAGLSAGLEDSSLRIKTDRDRDRARQLLQSA